MRNKKPFKLGDTFLTWVVQELVNPKKYRYLCKCSECGQEKEFIKYNLLKGSYAPCKKCGHKKVRNIPLIKDHWNSELNGAIFDNPENFSLTQSYWFICDNGHNFKSSIKDFRLDRCLGCTENPPNHPSKIQAKEYAIQYFKSVSSVKELEFNMLFLEAFDTVITLVEEDRYVNYRNYFSSEEEMLKEISVSKRLEQHLKSQGFDFIQVKLGRNLKNNVDTFKELMIQLVQRFDY